MADRKYLDYEGLEQYTEKVKGHVADKVSTEKNERVAALENTVKLTGDQTVGGVKKFSITPTVGEPSVGTDDNKIVIKRDVTNVGDIQFTERIL